MLDFAGGSVEGIPGPSGPFLKLRAPYNIPLSAVVSTS